MRQYQPIWEQIKEAGNASLIAPIESHRKIIQAVRKEKSNDRGYKLLMSEQGIKYEMRDVVEGTKIMFMLVDISGISLRDL